ncbi:unnamed protein product [Phaedon cochleariae]|uniref:Mutator-like transposase domain-containing protein n=1 Tax=Phaedon cochleariae TaxID=80249 RepID=A0A9N9SHI5_PHACE|nr:unnamed protein product [Phaedon cochleariae]
MKKNEGGNNVPIFPAEEMEIFRSSGVEDDYVEGRRIIDVAFFLQQVLNFPHHGLFSCRSNLVTTMKKETRKCFLSTFHLHCEMCDVIYLVHSENPHSKKINANGAAGLATISIGNGRTQMNEFVTTFNIPPMTESRYNSLQEELATQYDEQAWTCMIEAGQEEAKLAKENN